MQILENLFIHSDSKPANSKSTSDSKGKEHIRDKGKKTKLKYNNILLILIIKIINACIHYITE